MEVEWTEEQISVKYWNNWVCERTKWYTILNIIMIDQTNEWESSYSNKLIDIKKDQEIHLRAMLCFVRIYTRNK